MPVQETFWEFACRVYEREEVAPLCLQLQDLYGLDVNVLLFVLWCDHQGEGVTSPEFWEDLASYSQNWQKGIVKPIRSVRRQLKAQISSGDSHLEELRRSVLQVELQAESEQISQLQQRWQSCQLKDHSSKETMIRCYLTALGLPPDQARDDLLSHLFRVGG